MIYLAAPFFNEGQLLRIGIVEQCCRKADLKYFSPRHEGGVINDMDPELRSKSLLRVFKSNVRGMEASTLMLAGLDDKDTGTTWELGWYYGRKRMGLPIAPLITYSFRPMELNLMLSQSTTGHLQGHQQIEQFIDLLGKYPNDLKEACAKWKFAQARTSE